MKKIRLWETLRLIKEIRPDPSNSKNFTVMTFQPPTGHRGCNPQLYLHHVLFSFLLQTLIDECSIENDCHQNALCNNTKGSYNCTCKDGFEGDGKNCTGKILFKQSIIIKSLQNKNIQRGNSSCKLFVYFALLKVFCRCFQINSL